MEREQLKEILTGYRKAVRREQALIDAIGAKYNQATNTAAPSFDRECVQAGGHADRVGGYSVELVTMQDALQDARQRVGATAMLLLDTIDLLTTEAQKEVLTLRYLRGMLWEDIAEELDKTNAWTFNQHKQACAFLLTQPAPTTF